MNHLLTPGDVRTKIFTTHRISEGYDVDEVDAFLDQVSDSLQRLGDTCRDLSRQLEASDLRLSLALADIRRLQGLTARRYRTRRKRGLK